MRQPHGFVEKDKPNHVCRLHKAIYGLKQAPRAWYNELKRFLLESGFTNSLADASLFIFHEQGIFWFMLMTSLSQVPAALMSQPSSTSSPNGSYSRILESSRTFLELKQHALLMESCSHNGNTLLIYSESRRWTMPNQWRRLSARRHLSLSMVEFPLTIQPNIAKWWAAYNISPSLDRISHLL